MDIEFHYWVTAFLAKNAGFSEDETEIIAYSSQYVDDNDVNFEIKDRSTGKVYRNYISQTMNILKPKLELMRIYPIFHFIPGEPDAITARRRDGKMHILNTTPDSEVANEIIDAAFKVSHDIRLYRIGIASHSYVDTWAHQNFVGWYDYFNNIGLDIKPDIGHADAEHHPDWINHIWIDNRLVESDVNNRHRFLSAARSLFFKYCEYIKIEKGDDNFSKWKNIESDLIYIWGATFTGSKNINESTRIKGYKNKLNWLSDFDEKKWFDEAIKTKVHGMEDSQNGILSKFTIFKDENYWKEGVNKHDTHWYRFQQAIKEHEKLALSLLSSTFSKMGINLETA